MARPKNQEARRLELVHAAKQAIAERGVNGLRAIDVAAYSELGAGSVAYYYPDLRQLVREVHRDAVSRFYWARQEATRTHDDPRVQLRETIRSGVPVSRDDIDFQVLNELHTHAYRDSFHSELMAELYRLEVSLYTEVLERGEQAGCFTPRAGIPVIASNLVALEDAYGLHFMGGSPLSSDEIFGLILNNAEVMLQSALRGASPTASRSS